MTCRFCCGRVSWSINTGEMGTETVLGLATERKEQSVPEFGVEETISDWVGAGREVGKDGDERVQFGVPNIETLKKKYVIMIKYTVAFLIEPSF